MLREDGMFTIYRVQHRRRFTTGEWAYSALDHFLFRNLPFEARKGEIGDSYRELIRDAEMAHSKIGVSGAWNQGAADAAREAAERRSDNEEYEFRTVEVTIAQRTIVLPRAVAA